MSKPFLAKLTGFSDRAHAPAGSTLGACGSDGQNVIEALNCEEVVACLRLSRRGSSSYGAVIRVDGAEAWPSDQVTHGPSSGIAR